MVSLLTQLPAFWEVGLVFQLKKKLLNILLVGV